MCFNKLLTLGSTLNFSHIQLKYNILSIEKKSNFQQHCQSFDIGHDYQSLISAKFDLN